MLLKKISLLKIEIYLASLFLLFSPFLIFLFELKHSRYKKIVVFLILILAYIYINGINNFSGNAVSIQYISYVIVVKFLWINYLTRHDIGDRQMKVFIISRIVLIYIIFSFFFTYIFRNDLLEARAVYLIFGGEQNSTNFVNLLLMSTVVLLFSKSKYWVIYSSSIIILISVLWQNRTGMVLTPLVLLVHLLNRQRYLLSIGFILIVSTNITTLLNISTRLSIEGLETERTIIFINAYNDMINGNNFFGGYKVDSTYLVAATNWTHNLVLDVYRLSGIPGVIISVIIIIITLIKTLYRKENMLLGLFCWIVGFIISMTSVVFESTIFEFLLVFILLFNFYFLSCNTGRGGMGYLN